MELSARKDEFDQLGVKIAVLTYEPPKTNLKFIEQYNIGFPILSDTESKHIKAFGLLNESFARDHMAYGVPYPGIFVVDSNHSVRAKLSEDSYRDRPSIDLVLEAVNGMIQQPTIQKPQEVRE